METTLKVLEAIATVFLRLLSLEAVTVISTAVIVIALSIFFIREAGKFFFLWDFRRQLLDESEGKYIASRRINTGSVKMLKNEWMKNSQRIFMAMLAIIAGGIILPTAYTVITAMAEKSPPLQTREALFHLTVFSSVGAYAVFLMERILSNVAQRYDGLIYGKFLMSERIENVFASLEKRHGKLTRHGRWAAEK